MIKRYYGAAPRDVAIIAAQLKAEGIPVVAFSKKNKYGFRNAIISNANGKTEYIKLDKSYFAGLYFPQNGHMSAIWDIRMQLLFHEPIVPQRG